jgi:hypothetical protein
MLLQTFTGRGAWAALESGGQALRLSSVPKANGTEETLLQDLVQDDDGRPGLEQLDRHGVVC